MTASRSIRSISRAKGAAPIAGRAAAAPWQIMQRIDHPDAAQANAQALHDLENGATGLTLVFAGANGAHGFRAEPSPEAIEKILDGYSSRCRHRLELQIGPQSRMAAIHVAEMSKSKGFARGLRHPLRPRSARRRRGVGVEPLCVGRDRAGGDWRAQGLAGMGFKGPIAVGRRPCRPRCRRLRGAGARLCARGRPRLSARDRESGVALDAAQGMIYVRLAADADQFLTLAKFRAMRLLWARIESPADFRQSRCSSPPIRPGAC